MDLSAIAATVLASAVLASIPLMLAATGEAIGERAGVLNLGIEGTMLLAGLVAFRVALDTDSIVIGLLAGPLVGLVVGTLFGLLVTLARADQVLVGIGLTLAGTGLSGFLFREWYGDQQPLLDTGSGRPLASLADHVPVVGPALFDQHWVVYAAMIGVLLLGPVLTRTRAGLLVRATGEAPFAVDAAGISVWRVRLGATAMAGVLGGLAGAVLVVVELGFFRPGVTAGAGFIAIAVAMLGQHTPLRVAVASLVFGVLQGLGPGLQVAGAPVGSDFPRLLPYLGVVVALLLARHRVALPAALGRPYDRATARQDD
ncbi:MAG TPA: ABC transporter permease [Thermomicrobiales bacterium]|jgi:simple sugar transport system permease protein|nr:ABC transporter permease [Thermomicrobiales bacterium]